MLKNKEPLPRTRGPNVHLGVFGSIPPQMRGFVVGTQEKHPLVSSKVGTCEKLSGKYGAACPTGEKPMENMEKMKTLAENCKIMLKSGPVLMWTPIHVSEDGHGGLRAELNTTGTKNCPKEEMELDPRLQYTKPFLEFEGFEATSRSGAFEEGDGNPIGQGSSPLPHLQSSKNPRPESHPDIQRETSSKAFCGSCDFAGVCMLRIII